MRLDLSDLASVLLVLAALAVVLPKRDWRSIPARLRETRSGERRYLFGPPDRTGVLSSDLRVRTLQRLLGELRRGFGLGIPVLVAAWYAEIDGAEARRRRDAVWRESKQGLLLRHLAGEMTEPELHERLRQRGYLLPAPELTLPQARTFTMPPMRWRLEWEQRLKEMEAEADQRWAGEAASADATQTAAPPEIAPREATASATGSAHVPGERPAPLMEIHTMGEIRLLIDGRDVAPELLHSPALAFTVLYLLAWEVRRPGDRVTREFFGEETFRGQPPPARRRGVSHRLTNLRRDFPRLRSRIRTEGEYLGFDSAGCDIDVCWVFKVARQVKAAGGVLSSGLREDAQRALDLASREFLPRWENIESKGTLGGSGAAEVVADVRDQVVAARLDILGGLADAALAQQQLDDAVSHLEEALRLRPERAALARRLADLYERNGQPQRAARLRAEYGIDEAS
jgi:DNA-binding SARP family transcriptional activator